MKKFFMAAAISLALWSCANNNEETTTTTDNADAEMRDKGEASSVHPPEEGVPDSLKLVNDSVMVPEKQPNNR